MSELSQQLRCPNGNKGIEVAMMMDKTNRSMTMHAVSNLLLKENDCILEIGHGNAGHLQEVLSKNKGLNYFGIDISALMTKESQSINRKFVESGVAHFQMYDGKHIPHEDDFFDAVFSVNTLYFWENPQSFFSEIARTMKSDGRFVLTFADAEFMKTLPYIKTPIFTLYNPEDIENIASESLKLHAIEKQKELIFNKYGQEVEREFYSMIFLKNS